PGGQARRDLLRRRAERRHRPARREPGRSAVGLAGGDVAGRATGAGEVVCGLRRGRDVEVLEDLSGEDVHDFAVARNGRRLSISRIEIDCMLLALAKEYAALLLKMANQRTPLH